MIDIGILSKTQSIINLGVAENCLNALMQDSYLSRFAPKISRAVLKKNGLDSFEQIMKHVAYYPERVEKIMKDCFAETEAEWNVEKEKTLDYTRKAFGVIDFILARHAWLYDNEKPHIESLRTEIKSHEKRIEKAKAVIESSSDESVIRSMEEVIRRSLLGIERNEKTIGASDEEQVAKTQEEYMDILVQVDNEIAEMRKSFSERYPGQPFMAPKHLTILKELIMESFNITKDSSVGNSFKKLIQIQQYSDILLYGRELLLATAKFVPIVQKKYDYERIRYYNEEPDREKATEYRTKHLLPLNIGNMFVRENAPENPNYDLRTFILYGPAGIAKTAMMREMSKIYGEDLYKLLDYSCAQMAPEFFQGLPGFNNRDEADQYMLKSVYQLAKTKGLIFLDEATTAPASIRNHFLTLLQRGTLGMSGEVATHPLNVLVLAGNVDSESNTHLETFGGAVRTRTETINMNDKKALLNGWLSYLETNPYIQQNYSLRTAFSLLAKFLSSEDGKDHFARYVENPLDAQDETEGLPNMRSWYNAISYVANAIVSDLPHSDIRTIVEENLKKRVGGDAANAFSIFVEKYKKVPELPKIVEEMKKVNFKFADIVKIYDSSNADFYQTPDSTQGNKTVSGKWVFKADKQYEIEFLRSHMKDKNMTDEQLAEMASQRFVPDAKITEFLNVVFKDSSIRESGHVLSQNIKQAIRVEFDRAIDEKRPIDGELVENMERIACIIPDNEYRQATMMDIHLDLIKNNDFYTHVQRFGVANIGKNNGKVLSVVSSACPEFADSQNPLTPEQKKFVENLISSCELKIKPNSINTQADGLKLIKEHVQIHDSNRCIQMFPMHETLERNSVSWKKAHNSIRKDLQENEAEKNVGGR